MDSKRKIEIEQFHSEIRDVFERYGMIDLFYGGVDITGETTSGMRVGEKGVSKSNLNRSFMLSGLMMDLVTNLARKPPIQVIIVEDDEDLDDDEDEEDFK